jgi:hypothetical protein
LPERVIGADWMTLNADGWMHAGNMRMRVAKPLVPMAMRMRFSDWVILSVQMLMVLVVQLVTGSCW